MPKKKKKNFSKPKLDESTKVAAGLSSLSAGVDILSDDVSGWLELKVRKTTTKSEASKLKPDSTSKIALHEKDASRLGLRRKDEVLVCFKEEDESSIVMNGALICQIDIQENHLRAKNSIPVGTCHVSGCSFVDNILRDEGFQSSIHNPLFATLTTPIKTPSHNTNNMRTPQSGFSFASGVGGGGGDEVYATRTTPSNPTTPQSGTKMISSITVWVIPFSSALGKDATSILCQDATQLTIRIQEPAVQGRLSEYKQILAKLFVAQCSGRYFHKSEKIVIFFQGKPLQLTIETVDEGMSASEREQMLIELEMECMSFDDDCDSSLKMEAQFWKAVRFAVDSETRAQQVLLFRLTSATKIFFTSKSPDGNKQSEHSKSFDQTQSKVVAGLSSTLERLRTLLLTPLLKPDLFSGGSLKPPRGVLLHGSSGVGKTSLAKQIALDLQKDQTIDIHVEFVSCASLQSYSAQVGEAERRLTQIFEKTSKRPARSQSDMVHGSLLVFDDLHLICPKRSGYNRGSDGLTATLLALLDGIGTTYSRSDSQSSVQSAIDSNIVILGVTNRPSMLDPAVRRPGRLDYEIEVPIPDEAATRSEILRFQLDRLGGDFSMSEITEEDILSLGKLAKGFNGADCMLSVKEALRIALLRCRRSEGQAEAPRAHLTIADLRAAIRATKPSAIKSITVEIPKVHWSSIGGMDMVKKELREAIELPTIHEHLFQQLRIPPPRGILLYGPPGCSKTLMARALATEGNMNFLAVKGPELLSKWLGESERALASLFNRARMASPSIIFFDEIDSIGSKRGSGGIASGGGRLLSQLLTELDGINHTSGITIGGSTKPGPRVVVVGATNRPDLLDSALMRPGRIDRKIYVGLPDLQSRILIFTIGLRGKARDNSVDIEKLASEELSGGFSGAELIAACRDAALLALEDDESENPKIQMHHLVTAIKTMQRQIGPEMLQFFEAFRRSQDVR